MRNRVEVCLAVLIALAGAIEGDAAVAAAKERTNVEDVARPTRVIVHLRGAFDARLADAPRAQGGGLDVAALGADGTQFLAQHGVRRARLLYPARHRAGQGAAAEGARLADAARRRFARRAARAPRGARLPELTGMYVLDLGLRTRAQAAQQLAGLRADARVAYAEVDALARATYVPNDPAYASYGSWGQGYDDLYGPKKIGAAAAWDQARGTDIIVAVIDTGVDANHPDIDGNLWVNAGEIAGNGIDDDGNGFIDDRRGWDFIGPTYSAPRTDNDPSDGHGHGTHVAGTIAAEGDNGIGVVGVAWNARIMPVKGLDDGGWGLVSGLANAIVYAADNGADVINASWGGDESQAVREAVHYAHGLGVVFVAAAGNLNRDVAGFHPADHPDAITVAAVDAADEKAWFSNFGGRIDVAAPGVDILSLEVGTGGYTRMDGTSMAAPHVSGVAALILQAHPTFTNEQVRQVLRTSAADIGAPGKDPSFGYGRVNAAEALRVTEALEARLLSPVGGSPIHGPVALTGTVQGMGLDHYVLEFGAGEAPGSWTTLAVGTTPVNAGSLGTFDPSSLDEGIVSVRLRAISTSGHEFSDQIPLLLRYVHVSFPVASTVAVLDHVHKSGAALDVRGTASGVGFVRYRIEWAPGRDATGGWSTSGVTLVGGGLSATEGLLGRWTPAATRVGEHTVRVVVETATRTTTRSVTVYLEPDLVSAAWPQYVPNNSRTKHSPLPVRQADGSTKLLLGGRSNELVLFSADGASKKVFVLDQGGDWQPSVGEMDPTPGEEIVVADGASLRILSADLVPIRRITSPRPEFFGFDITSLADLDGDGSLEIVTVARRTDEVLATLQVYRANGQLYSSRYPLTVFSMVDEPMFASDISTVAADLDGDGGREIVIGVLGADGAHYTLSAVRADGTPYAAWTSPTFEVLSVDPLVAADLDRDGRQEIVLHELVATGDRVRVLEANGATRAGWPRELGVAAAANGNVALGDLDGDLRDEIVAGVEGGVVILRADGTEAGRFTWPTVGLVGPVLLADVDGDARPDVVANYMVFDTTTSTVHTETRLRAMSFAGALLEEWRLFGIQGWDAHTAVATVGDFTGDGRTDLAVSQFLNENGGVVSSVVRVLTTQAPFRAEAMPWPMLYGDAANRRSRPVPCATVKLGPVADAYVRGGSSAGSNFGSAAALEVKQQAGSATNNRVAYLRFPLIGVGRGVVSAKVRIHGRRPVAGSITDSLFAVASNTWSESGINWNNRPSLGAKQGAGVVVATTVKYYEWDVSAFVRAQSAAHAGAASFALRMDGDTSQSPDTFNSREAAAQRPELIVTSLP